MDRCVLWHGTQSYTMAVSSRRLLLATAVTCAGIAVAYLPPRGGIRGFQWIDLFSAERGFARQLAANLRDDFDALTLLEHRDSAMSTLSQPDTGGIFVHPAIPFELDSAIRVVTNEQSEFEETHEAITVAAAVFLDTIRSREGFPVRPPIRFARISQLFPSATDGHTCLAIAAIGPDIRDAVFNPEREGPVRAPFTRSDLYGVCDFLEAFGPPSQSVEAWLRAGAVTLDNRLTARCRSGDVDACEAILFRHLRSPTTPYGPGAFSIRSGGLQGTLPRFNLLDRNFLIEIRDSLGVEAFQGWWTAPGTVSESFSRAMGVPMEVWFRSWLQRRGIGGRPPSREALSVGGLGYALATMIAAFFVAAAVSRRRTSG